VSVPFFLRAYAWFSAAAGGSALWVAVLWYARSWDGGLQIPPPPPEDPMDLDALYGMNLAGILFEYGLPPLCLMAVVFGVPARKHNAAKTGLFLAAAALILYLAYMRSCRIAVVS
jgi:hypothetical protein